MSFLDIRCSFCGKHQKDVKKVVAGAKAFICNECVAIADRIMKASPDDPGDPPETKPSWWRSMTKKGDRS